MKFVQLIILSLVSCVLHAQPDTKQIVAEGKMLYRTERASWIGTDIFLNNFPHLRLNVGGYFSYAEQSLTKCLFFSKDDTPMVVATIVFDSSFSPRTAVVDTSHRSLTPHEADIYTIRKLATQEATADTMFRYFTKTNYNFIPLISDQKKVYILTSPQDTGVMIFGNDYLLTFDEHNRLLTKKQLHRNIIPLTFSALGDTVRQIHGIHSHSEETGELITPTDICTLMLYEKYTEWESHIVMGLEWVSIWDCKQDKLAIIPREVFER